MTDQPVRSAAPREERRFDQTHLVHSKHGKRVHRDYAAHFFKWGFATRLIKSTDRVLEVGCSPEVPLLDVLSLAAKHIPVEYQGVDLSTINRAAKVWATYRGNFNYVDRYEELPRGYFTKGVCIEVIEHMGVDDGRCLLEGLRHNLTPDATLILSTPVFNGRAARNHVHEYTIPELGALLNETGWQVEDRYGTFASYPDLKKILPADQLELLNQLREFYTDEVTACFLAPLYPDHSRNNVWVLTPQA